MPDYGGPNFELGMLAWNRKGYRAAASWFGHVPETSGHYREAQFLLGASLYRLAEYHGAVEAFERVAALSPSGEVENDLGAAESRLKNAAAIQRFRKSVELDPEDADYRFNLGYALWKKGAFEEAEKQFREALRLRPKDPEAAALLDRSQKRNGPRPADARSEGQERLKDSLPDLVVGTPPDSPADSSGQ